jgi:uncharacterized protein YvpB
MKITNSLKRFVQIFSVFLIITIIIIGVIFFYYNSNTPYIYRSTPVTEGFWNTYEQPIEIFFSIPVQKDKLLPSITPNIHGQWVWDSWLGIDNLTNYGKFIPSEFVSSTNRFVIYIAGVKRIGIEESHEHGIVFDAPKIPRIVFSQPNTAILNHILEDKILVNFDKPLEKNQILKLRTNFTKDTDTLDYSINSNILNIKIPKNLSFSTKYFLEIIISELDIDGVYQEHKIGHLEYLTINSDGFRSILPFGNSVIPKERIRIKLNKDVDQESFERHFSIQPNIGFKFAWTSHSELEIIKDIDLEKDTEYTLSIAPGVKNSDGTIQSDLISHKFKTIGRVNIKSVSPMNATVNLPVEQRIIATFDQPVLPESVKKLFFIEPRVEFQISTKDNITFEIGLARLAYNTNYTFGFNSGIVSVYGLDSNQQFRYSFSTRNNQIVLNIPTCSPYSPEFCQPQYPVSFSCNIYALKMVLSWKGYNLSATSIISEMGFDDSYSSGWRGNPNKVYVGNSDGSWGYGVYWDPSKKVLDNRGINSSIIQNWNVSGLAKEVEKGYPVVIWRYNGTSKSGYFSWIANDGQQINAINGQHGGVVTGFRGSSDNPTHILLNDPWFGSIWLDVNTFDYYWSFLNRVGLVIY